MHFRISGIDPQPYRHLFALSDEALSSHGIVRQHADARPGFPCRVSLDDAEVGEEVLLVSYAHHAVASVYRGAGPVYVRRSAERPAQFVDEVPESIVGRLLSVRGYDSAGMMRECDVVLGSELRALIERWFADERVAYLHVHNAKPGCFACAVERA